MTPRALVRTPTALLPRHRDRLREKLGVDDLEVVIDRTISGGFLVQMGDRYLDYTVDAVLSRRKTGREYSVGTVLQAGDGICRIDGLSTAMSGEIVQVSDTIEGMIMNLDGGSVGAVILGDSGLVKTGDSVRTTGRILSVPVGSELIGRVVNPLGAPLDGRGEIRTSRWNPMERIAPGVMTREPVSVPLQTGIKAIDAMIPIGRGQRELIIGDRQTGKTSIAVTSIINQKDQRVVCVYVAIGQRLASIAQFIATLEAFDALKHTIVVVASASDSPALQYLAPYAGCAIAEHFLEQNKDVLVVYDDLSKHAWAYRQMSLLLRRPSGREAYPGDIFYAHSRLLERACRLNKKHGGGSITALPIIETQAGDLSAYIPTNVISITDGQIYLESDLFNAGFRPAINVGNSVSRVGGSAQSKAVKQVAGRMRLDLAQYRELSAFAQFATDLDTKTQQQLNRGAKMTELLKQPWDKPMPAEHQIVSIWAGTHGHLDDLETDDVGHFETHLLGYIKRHGTEVLNTIANERILSDEIEKALETLVRDAKQVFMEAHVKHEGTPEAH